jgi:hypothetical protein
MTLRTITREQILAVMRDPRHSKRKLWTASVVLDSVGAYRRFEAQTNYRRNDRICVKRLLGELCRAGHVRVVKERHTLHSATGSSEIAYGLPDPFRDCKERGIVEI